MEKLEKFFNDIERIANALERTVQSKETTSETKKITKGQAEALKQTAAAPAVPLTNAQMPQVAQTPVMQAPIVQTQMPVGVPVSQQVESFSRDDIANALANATAIGRTDLVQNVFKSYGVQTLMEINPANYNQIATMLREAGIQI